MANFILDEQWRLGMSAFSIGEDQLLGEEIKVLERTIEQLQTELREKKMLRTVLLSKKQNA